ncbi:histone-binding protein N1/N2-like [Bufo bufo]|uniref:histone-binding protein N1/N2-like n=1 Tax=Bufo bufo TaxID=8384 RepID=UPI001ABE77E1|nr:histone-binding protein N1/N2-like [Bufo bufo]
MPKNMTKRRRMLGIERSRPSPWLEPLKKCKRSEMSWRSLSQSLLRRDLEMVVLRGRARAEKAEDLSAEPADGADVNAEAKRLMAMSSQDLVMKDVPSAVSALQKASGLLEKKYQETDDQHAVGVYYCEMALLEPKRLENNILSEPLEGFPEGDESGEDPDVPSASNLDEKEEEELRRQGYGPMSMKDEKANKVNGDSKETEAEEAKAEVLKWEKSSDVPETKVKAE